MTAHTMLRRIVLAAAVVGAIAYVFTWDGQAAKGVSTAVKGLGVGLLALYAALLARSLDGWLIALVMLLGMLGDVLLDALGLTTGAVSFLAAHLVAIVLYRRNPRGRLTLPTLAGIAVFVVAIATLSAWLPGDPDGAPGVALYSGALAAMAACAWLSRFPRAWVALGALLFLVSDLLIFAQLGPLADAPFVRYGIWGLYFAGQLLITLGVTRSLRRPSQAGA